MSSVTKISPLKPAHDIRTSSSSTNPSSSRGMLWSSWSGSYRVPPPKKESENKEDELGDGEGVDSGSVAPHKMAEEEWVVSAITKVGGLAEKASAIR